jgi:hypothetical protein
MNKRVIAVIAGTFLLQTAALAADDTAADTSSKVSAKKHFSLGKAIAKVTGTKTKESKQVASNEAQVGAY